MSTRHPPGIFRTNIRRNPNRLGRGSRARRADASIAPRHAPPRVVIAGPDPAGPTEKRVAASPVSDIE